MAQLVDWDLAATTARRLRRAGPRVTYDEAAEVVAELRRLTDEAATLVADYTGLRAQVDHPPVRVVDRADWAGVNIAGLREVVTPLVGQLTGGAAEQSGVFSLVSARVTGVQAGTVLGYLSGKVLGQYEVFTGDPGQLLLVAPNIVEAERKLGADPRDFRLWVCLHEVTHRTQFTAVPWLRGFFLAEVQEFVAASDADVVPLADRLRAGMSAAAEAIRNPDSRASMLDVVQTPGQRAVLDRLTAVMTLLEGHAEVVMDGVGPEVIPTVAEIRRRFNRRREAANPVEKLFRRLLGVEVKLRQYAEGARFVRAVVDQVGMDGFNRIYQSPETLPLLSEITEPDAWIARVHGPVSA
ncbi:zinc-dependent metalloprotease [Natronosporangium hydrolyticum]|uniref:Zinc-dependent metalloprotease n=1 Tax=Natronosporangium hydrolyticum TaxID=2811111 RepID=A0A895YEF1_9ACTN|nr:zinc-dependent metalloprotease [Natronosporangium hydrolyticum]QSB14535.1 zinc-dependent metalloprotease [Natronosporangium hydrolyticum]